MVLHKIEQTQGKVQLAMNKSQDLLMGQIDQGLILNIR